MNTNKQTARLAGALYLVVVMTGIFSLAYVPSQLIVAGDEAQTFRKIEDSAGLFRLGILSSVICYLAFLLLPFVLYRLLAPISDIAAQLMVIFAVVSVPISLLNLQNRYAVLTLVNGAVSLTAFDQSQLHAQTMLLLNNYSSGILIAQIFWGLWLLPFGFLVFRSGFLPKIFGILLMLGCFGYLVNFVGRTMMVDFGSTAVSDYITIPAAVGEIGICLWLLIRGINEAHNEQVGQA